MRTARFNVPGVVYHLIWRFVDRRWFFTSEDERNVYLRLLGRALEESDWRCLAYALMSNHIHHAMVAGTEPLSRWAKRAHSTFAQWMNRRHGRLGPVMADRPKDFAVRPRNEGRLIAYIHNNPVRASVVAHARASSWTSHRAYVGDVVVPAWLDRADGLRRSGFEDGASFDGWVRSSHDTTDKADLGGIRRALRKRGGVEVGTPTRLDNGTCVLIAARPFAHVRPDPRRLIEVTACVLAIPKMMLCSQRRNPTVRAARRVAVHCGKAMGLTGNEVAAALGVSSQTVSRIGWQPLEVSEELHVTAVCEVLLREIDALHAVK